MSGHRKNNWRHVQLGSLAEFRNGVNFSKENFGRGIKVIGVSDFQSNVRAKFDQLDEINPEGVVRNEHLLRNGDILFVRSNGNRDLIGRSMYVDGVPGEVTHSAFSIRLRFTSPECDPRFYSYLFRSQLIRKALSLYGCGTNISNLNQDILGRLQVPVPPLATQRHIAEILAAYDDLIENNNKRIRILEQMAQMLYREWFVNFRFPGHEKAKLVESERGLIPEHYKIGSLGDLAALRSGFPFKSSTFVEHGSYGIVTIRNVQDGLFSPDCQSKLSTAPENFPDYCVLKQGDVLMSLTGNIGRACLVYGRNLLLNQRVAKVIPKRASDLWYVYFILRMPETQNRLERISTGVAQQNLSPIRAMEESIVIPELAHREHFDTLVSPLVMGMVNLFSVNTLLRNMRDLLLPKLISGEISVEDVQIEVAAQAV